MRATRWLIFAAGIFAAGPAWSADWRHTGMSGADGSRVVAFIDAESLRRSSGRATFWAMLVFERATPQMDNARQLMEVDCSAHAYTPVQTIVYSHDVSNHTSGREAQSYAAPETLIYDTIDVACGNHAMDAETIRDPYASAHAIFGSQPR